MRCWPACRRRPGIYASIAPIILYAIFGTSRALAVGPVAVVSLMTAAAVGQVAEQGTAGYAVAALTLAFCRAAPSVLHGAFRLGFLANFSVAPGHCGLHHRVGHPDRRSASSSISSASRRGPTCPRSWLADRAHLGDVNWITLAIGVGATAFLFWVRKGLKPLLIWRPGCGPKGLPTSRQGGAGGAVSSPRLLVWGLGLASYGRAHRGRGAAGLPPLTMPSSADLWAASSSRRC
jgi:SulP family sulfate permease